MTLDREWHYRASDAGGRETTGRIRATSDAEAVSTLRARSLWVIDITPGNEGGESLATAPTAAGLASRASSTGVSADVARLWARWSGQDLQALAVLTRALATLLSAGVPLDQALAHAGGESTTDTASRLWQPMFLAWRDRVRRGEALSDAAAGDPRLPAGFAPALAAAEASGTLALTFARLADHLERRVRVQSAIRTALVYPTLLAVASLVGTLVILLVVVPRFAALLADSGASLPWATRLLIGAGNAVAAGGWWMLVAAVAVLALLDRSRRTATGRARLHASQLGWPVVGAFVRERDAARYLDTLAMALASGVPLLSAMRLARGAVENVAFADLLAPAETAVRDGAPLARPLQTVLPALSLRLLEAGESVGELPAMAARAADAADATAQRRLAQLVTVIEPALILLFGGIVGFVALALLQAIYGLNAGTL